MFKSPVLCEFECANDARSGGGKATEGFVLVVHESFAIVTRINVQALCSLPCVVVAFFPSLPTSARSPVCVSLCQCFCCAYDSFVDLCVGLFVLVVL